MNWKIERDVDGHPIRMIWLGPDVPEPPPKAEPEPFMPAMREWAKKHNFADEAERICNKTSEEPGERGASRQIDIQTPQRTKTK